MAARRYTADEVAEIVMNLPFDGDESELSDFEGSEGDEGDVTLNDQDELDEFSEESEEEGNNDMEDNPPVRHGNVFWSQRDEQTVRQYPEFTGCHGPTQLLGIDAEPVDFFDLLFPEQLWTLIAQETNKYRLQRGVSQWDNDTNIEEIRAFVGLLFGMGLHKVPEMKHYFCADWVLGVPAFAQVFTSKRWHQLWNYLHLADNDDLTRPKKGEQGYDKIWKIRPMFVELVPSFQDHFYIGQNVSVDEIMIKGKGKNPIKQYLPMKPIKRGSKIWALACSDCAYVFDLQVYLGKQGNTEHGLAHRVVTDLCLLNLGPNNHVVYMDNFFTGIPLIRQLENAVIYSVGTIRNNRSLYPACLKDKAMLKSMKRGEYHTASSGSMVASVWRDTKVVSFLSNVHNSYGTSTVERKKKDGTVVQINSPPCVHDYNANMGAVDKSDQLRQSYAIDRKSRRWWRRLFHFLLDLTMVNAYIIYCQTFKLVQNPPNVNQKPLSQVRFRSQVVKGLVGTFSCRKRPGPPNPQYALPVVRVPGHESVNIVSLGIKKRGRCEQCCIGVSGAKRRETCFGCRQCNKRLCNSQCHDEYHRFLYEDNLRNLRN